MKFNFKIKNIGIIAGLVTILMHCFANMGYSAQIYYVYHHFIFRLVRVFYDYTLGLLPFPVFYIFFFLVVYFSAKGIKNLISRRHTIFKGNFLPSFVFKFLNFIGWVISAFYFLWAFNYYGPDIEKKLNLPSITVDSIQLMSEFKLITDIMIHERKILSQDSAELHQKIEWSSLENEIRQVQTELLSNWGDVVSGRVRIRALYPEGLLLRISTAGVYIPFVCEGHIDPGMNPIQWPFTMAHEMAHGYGYTDEGVCNFIGLLTCMKSKDHFIRYSGLISYWRYLYYDIKALYPSSAKELFINIDPGVLADLTAIRRDMNRFPDILPVFRDIVYDSYLKSHGVKQGLQSYNEIIIQVLKWKVTSHAFSFK